MNSLSTFPQFKKAQTRSSIRVAGASFPGCFNCHDTQATTGTGVPQARNPSAPVLMKPGLINVSHIFDEVVLLNIN